MVGNFREGFIFVFFVSQEPFAKIKTAKIVVQVQNEQTEFHSSAYLELYSRQQNRVSECALTAIAEALQEIKMLLKHRRTNQTVAQGRERKQTFTTNILGTRVQRA